MAINPNIALSFQAPKIDDPLNKLAQMEQIKAYRQNALAKQMEMDTAVREREMTNALRQRLASGKELGLSEAAMFGDPGMKMYQSIAEAKTQEAEQKAKELEMASNIYKNFYLPKAATVQTAEDARKWAIGIQNDPRLSAITGQVNTEEALAGLPQTDEDVASWKERMLVPFKDIYKTQAAAEAAEESQAAAMERTRFTSATSAVQGALNRAATAGNLQESRALNAASDTIKSAFYTDSATGQIVRNPKISDQALNSAYEVLNKSLMSLTLNQPIDGMPNGSARGAFPPPPNVPGQPAVTAPPGTILPENLPAARAKQAEDVAQAKTQVKLKEEQPDIEKAILSGDQVVTSAMNQIDEIFNHPDLKDVTGNVEGWASKFMGLLDQGNSDANALIESLQSKAWLGSIQSFGKGSGLTPITNEEGRKLEQAYALVNQTMGTPAFQKNLIAFKDQLAASRRIIYNAYNEKYGKLNIKGWVPLSSATGNKVPQEAVDMLLKDPSKKTIGYFNEAFGPNVSKFVLRDEK